MFRTLARRPLCLEDEPGPADPPAPANPPADPPDDPPKGLTVDRAEWDRVQAENRRLRKAAKDAQDAEAQRKRDEAAEAAKAAGDFDKALGLKDEENAQLRNQLRQRDAKDAVAMEAAARGFNAEQAAALQRLVDTSGVRFDDLGDPNPGDVNAVVDGAVASFPNMFKSAPAPEPEDPTKSDPPPRQPRPRVPATPSPQGKPEGFISMEEYTALPLDARRSPEVQARLAKSRPYYDKTVPADSFAQGN